METALAHIGQPEPFGPFGAAVLGGGTALYLAATAVFARLVDLALRRARTIAADVLVIAVPVLALIPPMGALLSVVGALVLALTFERARTAST